ncbi:MAG TPA: rhodanese-like domain-containing protein [Geomobilimonas sp.]|nr:rhodanese-like domain-containing protein [Geomobilimonas sp.]
MDPRILAEKMDSEQPPTVIDVRTGFEFKAGHIPGAVNAPVWKILLRLVPLPQDKNAELVVLCELGPRAMMGKALLCFLGFRNVTLLTGHMAAWRRSGLPIVI